MQLRAAQQLSSSDALKTSVPGFPRFPLPRSWSDVEVAEPAGGDIS